jgi:hypothetical protein
MEKAGTMHQLAKITERQRVGINPVRKVRSSTTAVMLVLVHMERKDRSKKEKKERKAGNSVGCVATYCNQIRSFAKLIRFLVLRWHYFRRSTSPFPLPSSLSPARLPHFSLFYPFVLHWLESIDAINNGFPSSFVPVTKDDGEKEKKKKKD